MNSDYLRKQIERQSDLLKKRWNGEEGDPDVWNLEYMITEIRPRYRPRNRGVYRTFGDHLKLWSGRAEKAAGA